AERTPVGFEFAIKLYQKFTHPRMFGERVAKQIATEVPGDLRPDQDTIAALAGVNRTDIDEFRRGIEPIAAAGKLGALLAQFPPSFTSTPETREYLAQLLRLFGDYPVAVELRHRSWSDAFGETLQLLNGFQAAWAQIDEPK